MILIFCMITGIGMNKRVRLVGTQALAKKNKFTGF